MSKLTREQIIEKIKRGEGIRNYDLSHIDLTEINMRKINLYGARLSGANLSGSVLSGANLVKADLTGANLSAATLIKANLSSAKLIKANLSEADFIRTNLIGANLSGAKLSGADFSETNLSGTDLRGVDLSGTDLRGTKLSRTNLSGTDLHGTDLSGADLREANLNKTDLSGANLSEANLIGANLSGANLSGANLSRANFSRANLIGAKLIKANLIGANLSEANLREANLIGANLSEANLRDTDLASADFEDTNLKMANISGANIYHLKTHGWIIEGIKCTHTYKFSSLSNLKEREKYRRNFKDGDFEKINKSYLSIDLIFEKYSKLDHQALLRVIDRINQELPKANVKLRKIEQAVDTTASITSETKEAIKKVADMLPEQFAKVEAELIDIRKLFSEQKHQLQLPDWFTQQAKEIISHSSDNMLNRPINFIVMDQPRDFTLSAAPSSGDTYIDSVHQDQRQYLFSTHDEAEKVAQKIIDHLLSSDDIEKTLTGLDQAVSPQLEDTKKKNWLIKAFQKHKPSIDKIAETLTTIATGAGGGILAEILKNL